jgi:hypothetical protein
VPHHLEVIYPDGKIEIHNLEYCPPTVYIGRGNGNDVVIDAPGVEAQHLMLECRPESGFRIVVLSHLGNTFVGGTLLTPNRSVPLNAGDPIRLANLELTLYADAETAAFQTPLPPSNQPALLGAGGLAGAAAAGMYAGQALGPPGSVPESYPPERGRASQDRFTARPLDEMDRNIQVEFLGSLDTQNRNLVLEPGSQETVHVKITNVGNRQADFKLQIQGLPDWSGVFGETTVKILQDTSRTVSISIHLTRESTTLAGAYHFAITVTSPQYPDGRSRLGATLTVKPYYEFEVSDLSPKSKTISWFVRQSMTGLTISNRGNSQTVFRLTGKDDEGACDYAFTVPSEKAALSGQAPLSLAPQEELSLPIGVAPYSRPLMLRSRTHHFTITVTPMVEQEHMTRALSGTLTQRPLFGIIFMLLLLLLLCGLSIFTVQPRIRSFTVNNEVRPATIDAGGEAILRWETSWFSTNTRIEPEVGRLEETFGEYPVSPPQNTEYRLTANNFLSRILPFLSKERAVAVIVNPIRPTINEFSLNPNLILRGDQSILSWNVADADELVLYVDGNPVETLLAAVGQRAVDPEQNTTYGLEASNQYGRAQQQASLDVVPPPVPTPFIKKFLVDPISVTAGESVRIEWEIEGADRVDIFGIGSNLPVAQEIIQEPQQSTNYILNASIQTENGTVQAPPLARQVTVNTPTPTTTPQPTVTPTATPATPKIIFFTFSTNDDEDVVRGEFTDVTLDWSVDGPTTDVQLSGPQLPSPITNLPAQGSFRIAVDDTTTFVLTAINNGANDSATIEVGAENPTPTPEPPTPVPPAPAITKFLIGSPGSPRVVPISQSGNTAQYEVQIDSTVTFEWSSQNTNKVTFSPDGGSSQDLSSNGQTTQQITLGNINQTFTLIGASSDGQTTDLWTINVTVVDQPPPSPPFSVIGMEDVDVSNSIEWQWSSSTGRYDATGFRVYRANVPGGSFSVVADENDLDENARDWSEDLAQTCGRAYYVVAVYEDVDGNTQESAVSTNSWYSTPCP